MKKELEIERKFIIYMPDLAALTAMPEYTSSRITQIYLEGEHGITHRVRMREYPEKRVATETKKTRIDAMSVVEEEAVISESTFAEKAKMIARGTRPVIKTRHTFTLDSFTYEIDVYPEWEKQAILEIELPSRETRVDIPSFIRIVREVTGDRAYSNASLSHAFPEEDI